MCVGGVHSPTQTCAQGEADITITLDIWLSCFSTLSETRFLTEPAAWDWLVCKPHSQALRLRHVPLVCKNLIPKLWLVALYWVVELCVSKKLGNNKSFGMINNQKFTKKNILCNEPSPGVTSASALKETHTRGIVQALPSHKAGSHCLRHRSSDLELLCAVYRNMIEAKTFNILQRLPLFSSHSSASIKNHKIWL